MTASADHKVEMFMLARQRRSVGLPSWRHRIDISAPWNDETLTFEQRRDAIVEILRASPWAKQRAEEDAFGGLTEIIDNLADAENGDEFDGWWDDLYDEADYDRAWIKR